MPPTSLDGSTVGQSPPSRRSGPPFIRPYEALAGLPLELRWEATRRHGYYVHFWRFLFESPLAEPKDRERIRFAQKWVTNFLEVTLQVTGIPIDPATPASGVGLDQLSAGFRNGSIAPLTFRSMLVQLLLCLRSHEQQRIGELLHSLSSEDRSRPEMVHRVLADLRDPAFGFLDQLVPGLHFSVEDHAPAEAALDQVRTAIRERQQKLGIDPGRRRLDALPKYLEVWDLREGWSEGTYDSGIDMSSREIARRLCRPHRTVIEQYRSAFELITGYPYEPRIWFHIFGRPKIDKLFGAGERPVRSLHRVMLAAPRSETQPTGTPQVASATEQFVDDERVDDLRKSIQRLLSEGKTTSEVIDELELSDSAAKVVDFLRQRNDDGL